MFHRESSRPSRGKRIAAVSAAVAIAATGLFGVTALKADAAPRSCEKSDDTESIEFSDGRTYEIYKYWCDVRTSTNVIEGDPFDDEDFDTSDEVGRLVANDAGDNNRGFFCQVKGHEDNAVNGNRWYVLAEATNGNIAFVNVEYTDQGYAAGGDGRIRSVPRCLEDNGNTDRSSDDFVVPEDFKSSNVSRASYSRDDDYSSNIDTNRNEDNDDTNGNDDDTCSSGEELYEGTCYDVKTYEIFRYRLDNDSSNFRTNATVYVGTSTSNTNGTIRYGNHEFVCQDNGSKNPTTYNRFENPDRPNTNTWWLRLAKSEPKDGWIAATMITRGNADERVPGLKVCES